MQIILFRITSINYKFYAILINQIFILFLHEAYNYINFLDCYFMKLFDNTFNQRFPINL